jgi:hypothetical protein
MATEPPSDIARFVAALEADFDRIADADGLHRRIRRVVEQLLRREQDQIHCRQTIAAIDRFFATQPAAMPDLRRFCKQVVALSVTMRPSRAGTLGEAIPDAAPPAPAEAEGDDGNGDDVGLLPVPTRHDSFADLLAAALVYRIRHVTTFFQRRDAHLHRETLPPFLLSEEFDRRFETVIVEHIAPAMMKAPRFVGAFADARQWKRIHTAEFWAIVAENTAMEERLLATWRGVWTDLKPHRSEKSGKLVVSPGLARIRQVLEPGEPPAYALPKVGPEMINLFGRLLSDLRGELDMHWGVLVQIYQQEIERRSYHDRVRSGAMADAVANLFSALPGRLGEFVAILCHYNMAGIDAAFLQEVVESSAGTVFLAAFLAPVAAVEPAPLVTA